MTSKIKILRSVLFALIIMGYWGCGPETSPQIKLVSPDQNIEVILDFNQGSPQYSVIYDGEMVILPSALGYTFRNMPDMLGPFTLFNYQEEELIQDWTPVWGQEKSIKSRSILTKIELQETNRSKRHLNLHFRIFDDGFGFRYEIPQQSGLDSIFISSENTEFKFAQDAQVWWIPADYDSYEKVYTQSALSQISDSVHTPLTMITDAGYYVSIHEADLTRYASMTLAKDSIDSLKLVCDLVPWPDGDKVKTTLPLQSPWRTITIGRNATDLLESRLILNLNAPNQLEDVSWIKPMKYVGIWWGMHINKVTWAQGDRHGATTENTKRYIDFAMANNMGGVLVEGWNKGWEQWGQDDAFSFTQPYSDFDIEALTQYARERNISLIGHHETGGDAVSYEKQLDSAFAYYHRLGILAVKTGYAGVIRPQGQHHHGQWMVEHYRGVLEIAANYEITLDVHEPIKPTGIERTWPHMMTREGARGMEWNAWSDGNPPDHTTILPFTRLLAGPLDYTPGIFDLYYNQTKPENRVHTTLAKQLALMVVMYSPLQMAADLIDNYENQPAFKFIRDLKVDWDKTIYLQAEIGEQLAIARRQDQEWFIGAITNEVAREMTLPLEKLVQQEMVIELYADGPGADWQDNPYPIRMGSYLVNPQDSLAVWLAPGGGFAARLRMKTEADSSLLPIADFRYDLHNLIFN